jgi:predicted enzyme related to lactoylglutathione lyase
MKPVSYYVTVSNMQESLAFYSRIFDCTPAHIEERYSRFEISGFSFGLFSKAFETRGVIFGNNASLCFRVDDLDNEYNRLKSIVPFIDPEILELPNVRLFQFKDQDGNLLEVFQEK